MKKHKDFWRATREGTPTGMMIRLIVNLTRILRDEPDGR